jgi:hypothetical protein
VPSVAHGTQRVSKKDSVSDVSPDSVKRGPGTERRPRPVP